MIPNYLKKNDSVAIIATARKVSSKELLKPIRQIRNWGLNVVTDSSLYAEENQFAGSDDLRAKALQWALDNSEIKAIFIARGGYGTMRIIDKINFSKFKKCPKWIVGFSDITVLHSHIENCYGISTLHAPMPLTFSKNLKSVEYLRDLLFGKNVSYVFKTKSYKLNKIGDVNGSIVGGNLSILYSLLGSKSDIDTKNKILFIEDLDEYLYHIDRMILSLKRAGKLKKLKGLVIGSMLDMKDNIIPFGKNANEIIFDAIKEYDYPVVFNFPSGHDLKNFPIKLGSNVTLSISDKKCELKNYE